jgi:hypothetical protein
MLADTMIPEAFEHTPGAPVDLGVRKRVEQPRTREESVTETVVLCLPEPRAVHGPIMPGRGGIVNLT